MSYSSNFSNDLIVILGPTATGKTKLAVQLAQRLDGEIISADSRQVYRGMDIGTGKDLNEYIIKGETIPYHLIDIVDPSEEYNVAQFQNDFQRVFTEIKGREKLPILCGGTGFYLKSVLMDFQLPSVKPDKKLRAELETWKLADLIQELESISPGASTRIPLDTKRRVIRGIEIGLENAECGVRYGKPRSPISYLRSPIVLGVDYPREVVRERITFRLHQRLGNGMIEEIESLLKKGVSQDRLDSFGLEYRFISRFFQGQLTKVEMTAQLNTAIHQFAKKQMTFFRNMEKNGITINWIPEGDLEIALDILKG